MKIVKNLGYSEMFLTKKPGLTTFYYCGDVLDSSVLHSSVTCEGASAKSSDNLQRQCRLFVSIIVLFVLLIVGIFATEETYSSCSSSIVVVVLRQPRPEPPVSHREAIITHKICTK